MLCFIVHSTTPPNPEQHLAAGDPVLPPPPPPYAALAAAHQRAACRLLRLSPAAWEPRGRCQRLLFSSLLPSPVRELLGPERPPGEIASEMVCKRKGAGLPACPPCKQPRSAAEPEASACQCPGEAQLCALPAAAGCAAGSGGVPSRSTAEGSGGGGQPASPPPAPAPEERENERGSETGCEEPQEHPGDCCREVLPPPTPDINQLPPSILLKVRRVGSGLDGRARERTGLLLPRGRG